MRLRSSLLYFNPHSREGSDALADYMTKAAEDISIHTPAKGVTLAVRKKGKRLEISIHTPAKGVTAMQEILAPNGEFQSTLPRRE